MKYIYCVCLFLCQSCFSKYDEEHFPNTPLVFSSPNKMYARDSFYFAYTLSQFSKGGMAGYWYDFEKAGIDTILYSPDTLKFFALDIVYRREDTGLEYDGHAILGYRLATTDSWIVYPVDRIAFVGYKNYNMVRDRLRREYFQNFGNPVSGIWNYRTKQFETDPSYNVTDGRFWDNSFIWQKGVSIPGYYAFQLSGNGDPEMPHPIIEIPPVHYPDSLLKLYHENRW